MSSTSSTLLLLDPTGMDSAPLTHSVSAGVDDSTGDYVLTCTTCDWHFVADASDVGLRRLRRLGEAMFDHIDFGDLFALPDQASPHGDRAA